MGKVVTSLFMLSKPLCILFLYLLIDRNLDDIIDESQIEEGSYPFYLNGQGSSEA